MRKEHRECGHIAFVQACGTCSASVFGKDAAKDRAERNREAMRTAGIK